MRAVRVLGLGVYSNFVRYVSSSCLTSVNYRNTGLRIALHRSIWVS
jgi:hypothetical protein